jgi:ribonuclease HI
VAEYEAFVNGMRIATELRV